MTNSPENEICSKCGRPLDLKTALIKEEEQQRATELQDEKIAEIKEKMFEMQNEMILQRSNFTFFKAQMGIPTEVSLRETESQEHKKKSTILNW